MIGIKPHEFRNMTPRELMICFKAYEFKNYGIYNGVPVSNSSDMLSDEEWHAAWQEKWDNPDFKNVEILDN